MIRPRDLLLLAVVFSSLFAGILAPGLFARFQPYPLYCMMSLLFLSFLSIRLSDIWSAIKDRVLLIIVFLTIRVIIFPLAVGLLFRWLCPTYSLAALLLSGVSTGVVAPFFANLLHANGAFVLVVVVTSSLLVPFTLPALVDVLFGRSLEISLWSMVRLLFLVIFIPVLAAELVRRVSGGFHRVLLRRQYPISLVLFAITNLGIFSVYSDFFRKQPVVILESIGVTFVLGGLYLFAGLLIAWGRSLEEQLSSAICFGIMNNVLVIVFSSQFFTPIEPTVAALYIIPFFGLLLPLRAWRKYKESKQ